MRRWVHKAIDVVLSLLLIMATILGDIVVAVLTEFGLLPDIAWLGAGVLTLIAAGLLVITWKF